MDRMPGRVGQPWCPSCHAPPSPDCPDRSKSLRQVRQMLKQELEGLIMGDDDDAFWQDYAEQRRREALDEDYDWVDDDDQGVTLVKFRQLPRAEETDFFVEDQPVENVIAAFEAGEKFFTEPPTDSTGWCAPSP
jgi:hypothetical protein